MVDSNCLEKNKEIITENIKINPDKLSALRILLIEAKKLSDKNNNYICTECCSTNLEFTNRKPYNLLCKACGRKFSSQVSSLIFILLNNQDQLLKQPSNNHNESTKQSLSVEFSDKQANEILNGIFPFPKAILQIAYVSNLKKNKVSFIKKALTIKTKLKINDLKNITFLENGYTEIIINESRASFIKQELATLAITPVKYDPFSAENKVGFEKRMKSIMERTKLRFSSLHNFCKNLMKLSSTEERLAIIAWTGGDVLPKIRKVLI